MRVALRPLPWRVLRRKLSKLAQLSREEFQPVIGLEVHVQLNTKSKLFSRAPCDSDAPPNSQVAAFDMATPGTLPMLNKSCVMHALRMAVLLNCEIPPYCRFDRKHYFYADMPAGYQITQSDQPVARNGRFTYSVYSEDIPSYNKEVRITQLQLEQDSGKTIHFGQSSLIDLNRAGAPLVEVVSEPDFSTALEAMCFVQQLRLLLMHHGICQGEMHKGHLRVDANVSLSHDGNKGVRTEVKNINSLRHLHTAINFEINRQYEVISSGNRVINETRTCDEHGRTVSMRDKEEITDYRFIPEPNLPFLKVSKLNWNCSYAFIEKQILVFSLQESTDLSRFVNLCADRLKNCGASEFVTWMNELKMMMLRITSNTADFDFESVSHQNRGRRAGRADSICSLVFNKRRRLIECCQLFNENNLWRITDEATINKMMEEVLAKNEKLVQKASTGHAKSVTKLRNLLVDSSKKRIDSEQAENAIVARLNILKSSTCSEK
ncbi:unnamed protein product [Haemonchus placei]|uniref:Glutamyl-tRNA(Gln) amidotransferase subunit B, mitochondrial n=1 Tax=Haemonchus placei TaxID=6290 RepID=A0A0N4W1G3_HAEPC|nr:unnamed protein product [Haemonchus placei]